MSRRFLAFSIVCAAAFAHAQSAVEAYGKLRAQAREAYLKKDYAAAQPLLERLYQFTNGSSRAVYNLASVAAAQGDKDRAFKWLGIFVDMGQAMDLSGDPSLKILESDARFKEFTNRMQQNQQPVDHSAVAFKIADSELLTEDIAYDSKRKNFYVSSIRGHKIVRIDDVGHALTLLTVRIRFSRSASIRITACCGPRQAH